MIQELSYVGIASPRAEEWRSYGTDFLGAMLTEDGPDGAVRLAVDDINYRIAIHPGTEDEFRYAGWGLANETDLRAYVDQLTEQGIDVQWGDARLCRERQVAELAWFCDPWGLRHELTWGKAALPLSFRPGRAMKGRFVTGGQGLGHVVFEVPDIEAANKFYSSLLGFRLSDRIIGDSFHVRFYHINGRHHSLALSQNPGHIGFNHMMLEYEEMDDLGTAIDLQAAHGVETMQTLGRHTNDLMTSTYVASPSGLQIELGHGGLVVDDLSWVARTFHKPSYWGHKRPTGRTSRPGILKALD
ncbi:VOC family protein [Nocardia sp. NPDC046763]|uniref:VOC family protein n=1 Tax=Nocardia sp. NPDC046763 TaxID=3155256 RepID=UPI0033E97780